MHNAYYIDTAVTALRSIKTQAVSRGDPVAAEAFVRAKGWSDRAEIVARIKASVSGIESGDVGAGQAFDFQAAASGSATISRLPGLRRLPPRLSLLTPTSRLIAAVVGEGKAVPALPTSYVRQQIQLSKIAAIFVASNESMKDDLVEAALAADLLAACAAALDHAAFASATVGSLTHGATAIDASVTSVTELDTALAGAVDALVAAGGSLSTSAWVMPSWLGLHLGLLRSSGQLAYPDVGATGGSIAKLPVLTWDDVAGPSTNLSEIALIDGALVGYADGQASLRTSQDAMIEQTTLPLGDSIAPTAASVNRTSMFDADATAILATLRSGWIVRRAGAVQVITGVEL